MKYTCPEIDEIQNLSKDFFKVLDYYKGHSDCICDRPEPANPSPAYIAGRSERYQLEANAGAL